MSFTPTLLQHDCPDLGLAIKMFLRELPNPNGYPDPSITESIFIAGEEVKLCANKNRGMEGVIWNVDIL